MIEKKELEMSSDKRRELVKVDKQETPDSTTKERNFFEGEEIFVLRNDQFVFGKIEEVDIPGEKCLVTFKDGDTIWALFKDLKPSTIDINESPVKCIVCKSTQSKKNNVVVACETCLRGYHQKCHQPVIVSVDDDWSCKKCRKKRNCQLSANTVTQKTVSSTSKDSSLPQSSEDLPYDYFFNHVGNIRTHHPTTLNSSLSLKCKSDSLTYYFRRVFQTTNCGSDTQLPELPPTPPSSVSAPETPQPSIVNGEPPTSPTGDVSCGVDFDDVTNPNDVVCNISLEDIFADNKEPQSDISLPLLLNHVIVDPLVRPMKRKLSEADIIMINGEMKYKKRRFRKRCTRSHMKTVDVSVASTSKLYNNAQTLTRTPVKTIPNNSAADLKSLVHRYFADENKRTVEQEIDKFATGEEYRICGKRQTLDGRIQYLVEWVKCTDPI